MANILNLFRGSTSQFEQILEPHLEGLYHLAYRFTGQQHDAEDLVQDLVLKLYQKQSSLLKAEEPRSWLARSLRNLYIDSIRKENRTPHGHLHEAGTETLNTLEDTTRQPDTGLAQSQLQAELISALGELKQEQRDLVIMHDVEGYTLKELTQVFDMPLGTLKSRLHRAHQRLKKNLKKMEPSVETLRVSG